MPQLQPTKRFSASAVERQRDAVQRQLIRCLQRLADGDLQRGGGAESRPLRYVAADHHIDTTDAVAALLQVFYHPRT